MSVAQYGPKLLEFWRAASLQPMELTTPEHKLAIQLRHRLYKLRLEIKRDKEPEMQDLFRLASRVTLRIEPIQLDGLQQWRIIAAHSDEQFDELLTRFTPADAPELKD